MIHLARLSVKFQRLLLAIQYPAKDLLLLVPAPIPFAKFLFRYGFLAVHGICISPSEHLVDGVHDAPPNVAAAAPGPLRQPDEVVNEDINMCDQPQEDQEGYVVFRLWQRPSSG